MVNPIALIKQGIQTGDWEPVCQAYEIFTSEKLDLPEEQDENALNILKKVQKELDCFFNPVITKVIEDEDEPVYNSPSITQQDESIDLVSVRARELKDAKDNKQNPSIPEDKFKVEPKQTRNGKTYTKGLQIIPGMVNNWKDDGKLEKKFLKDSKISSSTQEIQPRRPPTKKIKVVCEKCQNPAEVLPIYGPKMIEGELSSYVCDNCIRRGKR